MMNCNKKRAVANEKFSGSPMSVEKPKRAVIPSLSRDLLNIFIQSVKPDRLNVAYKVGALRSFDFAQDDMSTSLRMTY